MDLYSTFAVDEERLQYGVWWVIASDTEYFPVPEAEIGDRMAVLIASMHSPKYRKAIERRKKRLFMRRSQEISDQEQERITNESIAEAVILSWKNFEIKDGHVPYSQEQALEYLTKPAWVKLRMVLMAMIYDENVFKIQQEEAVLKNS